MRSLGLHLVRFDRGFIMDLFDDWLDEDYEPHSLDLIWVLTLGIQMTGFDGEAICRCADSICGSVFRGKV